MKWYSNFCRFYQVTFLAMADRHYWYSYRLLYEQMTSFWMMYWSCSNWWRLSLSSFPLVKESHSSDYRLCRSPRADRVLASPSTTHYRSMSFRPYRPEKLSSLAVADALAPSSFRHFEFWCCEIIIRGYIICQMPLKVAQHHRHTTRHFDFRHRHLLSLRSFCATSNWHRRCLRIYHARIAPLWALFLLRSDADSHSLDLDSFLAQMC